MTGRTPLAVMLVLMATMPLAAARAAPANLDGLVRNSPFNAAPSTAASAPADSTLEFRGVLVDGGEQFFSLYDPATRVSMWVGLKEAGNPFTVQSYDAAKGVAAIEYQGRTLALALKQAKVVALSPAALPGPPGPGMSPNAAPAANPNEASRLAAVAEEIRRRRALRAQSQNNPAVERSAPPKPNQN